MEHEGWSVLDEERGVLWREYEFSRGAYATTLVFRGVDGLVVVSPSSDLDARAMDALAERGRVSALVANNAGHHLGQPSWRARFPDAIPYAPAGSLAALDKKQRGGFRPLTELALPEGVEALDPPGFKGSETILRIASPKGCIWYTGDLLTNIERTPGPPLRWLFTMSGSAPGFRLFRLGVWAFVRDRPALRAWMLEALAQSPPAIIVPGHGKPIEGSDVAERAVVEIQKL